MAQKRMFAKTIISSDAFLTLSHKAQCLYMQLSMEADDAGVVNNTRSIINTTRTTMKEYKELLAAKFIIEIDGLTVIKHWNINNTIRSDRKKPSNYTESINKLEIDSNGAYRLVDKKTTKCQPNVNQMTTKYSIVENSIDKIREDKDLFNYLIINGFIKNIAIDEARTLFDLIRQHGQERVKQVLIQINRKLASVQELETLLLKEGRTEYGN